MNLVCLAHTLLMHVMTIFHLTVPSGLSVKLFSLVGGDALYANATFIYFIPNQPLPETALGQKSRAYAKRAPTGGQCRGSGSTNELVGSGTGTVHAQIRIPLL